MRTILALLMGAFLFVGTTSCAALEDYGEAAQEAAAARDSAIDELRVSFQAGLDELRVQLEAGQITDAEYTRASSEAQAALILAMQEVNQEFADQMLSVLDEVQAGARGFLGGIPSTGNTAIDALIAAMTAAASYFGVTRQTAKAVNVQRDLARAARGEPTNIKPPTV